MIKLVIIILLSIVLTVHALDTNRGIDISFGYPYETSLRGQVFVDEPTTIKFYPRNHTPTNIVVNVYTSLQDIYQSLQTSVITQVYLPGSFEYSSQSSFMKNAQGNYTAFTYQNFNNGEYSLEPSRYYTPEISKDFHNLPEFFTKDSCNDYKDFVEKYGTHYISNTVFGGQIIMTSTFTKDMIEYDVTSNLQELFTLLTSPLPLSPFSANILQNLLSDYPSTITLVGGYPEKYTSHTYREWLNTLYQNPAMTTVSITPLSGKNLDKAIRLYLDPLNLYIPSTISPRAFPTALNLNGIILIGGYNPDLPQNYKSVYPLQRYDGRGWSLQQTNITRGDVIIGNYFDKVYYVTSLPHYLLSYDIFTEKTSNITFLQSSGQVSTIINGVIYFLNIENTISFNISTGELSNSSNHMKFSHEGGATVYCDEILYILGGSTNNAESFNTITGEWSVLPDMIFVRWYLQAACINNIVYAIGGNANGILEYSTPANIEKYENGRWEVVTNFPNDRMYSTSMVIGGNIYIFSGLEASNPNVGLLNVDIFNTDNNTWNSTPLSDDMWC